MMHNAYGLPGDKARGIRGEVQCAQRDVRYFTEHVEGAVGVHFFFLPRHFVNFLRHFCDDKAGIDGIDPYSDRAEAFRKRPAHASDRTFFEPEYVGKLNFYVNAVDELLKSAEDNPTIGLLICRDKDQTEVQWSFKGIQTPIGVASYDNVRMKEVQAQLPTEEQIRQRI